VKTTEWLSFSGRIEGGIFEENYEKNPDLRFMMVLLLPIFKKLLLDGL
jgi:hypothetical protein